MILSQVRIAPYFVRWGTASILLLAASLLSASAEVGVSVKVVQDGRAFAEYVYRNTSRPYLYPILGPKGLPMTRNWPMAEAPHEQKDHPHQKSFWFAHGDVNGVDFWAEGPDKGKIVHDRFTEISGDGKRSVIRASNRWVGPDGKVVCTDDRVLRFQAQGEGTLVDFEITLHASEGDLKFGDTKEGTMGIRIAETMRLKGEVGRGHIVNSEGLKDDATWGKRARWCDYYGPVQDTIVGIAFFDHPKNPRFPTWWHVRDYGLFAANPFGIHDFEKKPKNAGDLVVPKGENLTFRYRFYFHLGDAETAQVAQQYQTFVNENP